MAHWTFPPEAFFLLFINILVNAIPGVLHFIVAEFRIAPANTVHPDFKTIPAQFPQSFPPPTAKMDYDVHEHTHLQVRWSTDCETRKYTVHITCTNGFPCPLQYQLCGYEVEMSNVAGEQLSGWWEQSCHISLHACCALQHKIVAVGSPGHQQHRFQRPCEGLSSFANLVPKKINVSIFLPINILILSTQHYHPFLIRLSDDFYTTPTLPHAIVSI